MTGVATWWAWLVLGLLMGILGSFVWLALYFAGVFRR